MSIALDTYNTQRKRKRRTNGGTKGNEQMSHDCLDEHTMYCKRAHWQDRALYRSGARSLASFARGQDFAPSVVREKTGASWWKRQLREREQKRWALSLSPILSQISAKVMIGFCWREQTRERGPNVCRSVQRNGSLSSLSRSLSEARFGFRRSTFFWA